MSFLHKYSNTDIGFLTTQIRKQKTKRGGNKKKKKGNLVKFTILEKIKI